MDEEKWMNIRPNLLNLKNDKTITFHIAHTEIDCHYNRPFFEYSLRLTTSGLLTKSHLQKIIEISNAYNLNVSIETTNNRQNIIFS